MVGQIQKFSPTSSLLYCYPPDRIENSLFKIFIDSVFNEIKNLFYCLLCIKIHTAENVFSCSTENFSGFSLLFFNFKNNKFTSFE